jgi:hypothetical protein
VYYDFNPSSLDNLKFDIPSIINYHIDSVDPDRRNTKMHKLPGDTNIRLF